MEHYGAKPENYSSWSSENYRMGSEATNMRDRRLDDHLIGEIFRDEGRKEGYDAQVLQTATGSAPGLSLQQQLDGVKQRFDQAKVAYEKTKEYKFFMMQKDLRDIADEHLDADLRQFQLSHVEKQTQ